MANTLPYASLWGSQTQEHFPAFKHSLDVIMTVNVVILHPIKSLTDADWLRQHSTSERYPNLFDLSWNVMFLKMFCMYFACFVLPYVSKFPCISLCSFAISGMVLTGPESSPTLRLVMPTGWEKLPFEDCFCSSPFATFDGAAPGSGRFDVWLLASCGSWWRWGAQKVCGPYAGMSCMMCYTVCLRNIQSEGSKHTWSILWLGGIHQRSWSIAHLVVPAWAVKCSSTVMCKVQRCAKMLIILDLFWLSIDVRKLSFNHF